MVEALPVTELICLPILIGLNAFFVAAEYALVTIRTTQIEELRREGISAALILGRLKEDVAGSLATMQICITATNLIIGAVAEPAMTQVVDKVFEKLGMMVPLPGMHGLGLALGLLIVTFWTVVLSELLPKALSLQYTQRIAITVAPLVELLRVICSPLVRLMNWTCNLITGAMGLGRIQLEEKVHSEDELEMLVDKADAAGEFQEEHGDLLRRAFDFADLTVRNVMVPLHDAGVIDATATVDALAERLSERPFTRWALRDPATGKVTGIVNVKMALYAKSLSVGEALILQDLASPPTYVMPEMPLVDALEELRHSRRHLAIVRDKDLNELGVISLEDILESIVGHIPSEEKPTRPKRSARHPSAR